MMDEPARSALISLAEQEIARRIALECVKHLRECKASGNDADDAGDRTNVYARLLLNQEMVRHDKAIEAAIRRVLRDAAKVAGCEGIMP